MPDLTPYRQQARAQNNLRVVRNARPDPNTPQLGDFVQAAGEFVDRIESARAEQEVVDTELKARREYDAAYRELEQDGEGDYEEFESRLMERSREVRGKILEGVKSGAARKAVEGRLDQIETGYVIRTRDLQRTRAVEDVKAGLIARTSALEETAKDPSVPFAMPDNPNVRSYAAEQEVVLAEINSMQRKGFLAKDDAERMRVQIEAQGRGAQSLRHTSTIDTLMDKGLHTEAEEYFKTHYGEISPETREKIESAIEVKGLVTKAVQKADELMVDAGGDYDKALTEVRKIKDVDLRLEAEARLNTMRSQDNAADAERQDDVRMKGMEPILAGGGLANIPASVMREADPDTRQFWNDMIYSRRQREQTIKTLSAQERAALKEMQATTTQQIKGMAVTHSELYLSGPASWQNTAPGAYQRFNLLDSSDQEAILNDIAERKQNGNTQSTVDRAFLNLNEQAERLFPERFTKGSLDSEATLALQGELRALAEQELRDNGGKPLTTDRVRALVGVAAAEVETSKGALWWRTTEPLRPLTEEEAAQETNIQKYRRALQVSQALPDYYRAARLKLIESGETAPTEYQIADEALAMRDRAERDEAVENAVEGVRTSINMVTGAFGAN